MSVIVCTRRPEASQPSECLAGRLFEVSGRHCVGLRSCSWVWSPIPTSSKDIRRLTTLARVIDVEEKANLVARLLVGLASEKGIEVMALDDSAALVRRAVGMAGTSAPSRAGCGTVAGADRVEGL
jgi:hypothetical protein